MTLDSGTKYPARRAYVLKMRGDAGPGALCGRLVNLVTGQTREFATGVDLLDAISSDLAAVAAGQHEISKDIQP